ncbi:hypothetical protein [Streptomyces sp. C36]|uniref:hypothetical protein n=1 Tax=Streptomyces sp. C36 TaxID=3237122 RepID=UPI0034C679DB
MDWCEKRDLERAIADGIKRSRRGTRKWNLLLASPFIAVFVFLVYWLAFCPDSHGLRQAGRP